MPKTVIARALVTGAAALALALAGCGDDGSAPPTDAAPDHTGDGGDGGAPQLAVTSVLPAQGPVDGGTLVMVSGHRLPSGARSSSGPRPGGGDVPLGLPAPGRDPARAGQRRRRRGDRAQPRRRGTPRGGRLRLPGRRHAGRRLVHDPVPGHAGGRARGGERAGLRPRLGAGLHRRRPQLLRGDRASSATARGADPSAAPDSFNWVGRRATTASHRRRQRRVHRRRSRSPAEGAFAYAYRVSLDDGASWTYCDLDGSANGFQADQHGSSPSTSTS